MANPNDRKYNYMLNCNKNHMNDIALTFDNKRITYEEMHNNMEKYAKALYKKGIRQGDIIGVCTLNTPESVYLLYALDIIGAIVVGFSPFDNKEKIKKDIEITKPKMIITTDMNYTGFKDLEKVFNFSTILYSPVESLDSKAIKMGYKIIQIAKGNFKFNKNDYLKNIVNYSNFEEVIKAPYIEGELSDIVFTGGSTGVHKGVDLTGSGVNHVIEGMRYMYDKDFFTGKTYLGNIPFGHMVYGRTILHIALTNNMTYALTLKAMPKDFYDEIVRTGANCAVGGPPHWGSLVEKQNDEFVIGRNLKKDSLKNLELATSGGEAMKKNLERAVNQALNYCGSKTMLGDGLGATEAWSVVTLNSGKSYSNGTIGSPISTLKVKLINPTTGEEVKKGEKGLLCISGPSVMLGYHNNPEETKKVITYDDKGIKWCNLGDFLVQTCDNTYKYVGRLKRNFVCGVENIYPEQLEELLSQLPEIKELVITSVPDDILQHVPIYHISLNNDEIDTDQLESKIKKIVEKKLSPAWLPHLIIYNSEPLKRMLNSKVDIPYYQSLGIQEMSKSNIKKQLLTKK